LVKVLAGSSVTRARQPSRPFSKRAGLIFCFCSTEGGTPEAGFFFLIEFIFLVI